MGIKLFLLYLIVVTINFSKLEDKVAIKNTELKKSKQK